MARVNRQPSNSLLVRSLVALVAALALAAGCAGEGPGEQTADCMAGTQNCACRADQSCDSLGGLPMACVTNLCTPAGAPDPGTLGGYCDDSVPCGMHEGQALACLGNLCERPGRPPVGLDVSVLDDTIRACDVLVRVSGGTLTAVAFDDRVLGEHQRRSPQAAVSFAAVRNQPITGSVAAIELTSGGTEDATLEVVSAECFDELGQPIGGAGLVVE